MIKFVVLFNKYDKAIWQNSFDEYFERNEVVDGSDKVSASDFSSLLTYLNKEAYYEKV